MKGPRRRILRDSSDDGQTTSDINRRIAGLKAQVNARREEVADLDAKIRQKMVDSKGFERELEDRALARQLTKVVVRGLTWLTRLTYNEKLTGSSGQVYTTFEDGGRAIAGGEEPLRGGG